LNPPPRRPQRQRARSVEAVRALTALLTVAALLGGIPVLLWRLGGWPLPHTLPSLTELRLALTRPLPDDVIANTLVTLAWAWWAHFLVCLVIETICTARGRMPIRIPGGWLHQAIAARLIGAILLMTPSVNLVQPGAIAAPSPIAAVTSTIHSVSAQRADEQAPAEEHPVLKRYIVRAKQPGQPHDTLWGIAERHLGDPFRWPEIWALNQGRPLPNPPGGRFTDQDRIWPGQELLLPPDAVVLAPNQHPPIPPPKPSQPTQPQPRQHQPAPPPSQPPLSTPTTSPERPTPLPEAAPTSTSPPDHQQPGQLPRIVAGLAGAGLLAVGVIALLTTLRRRQQRARRPDRRIPLPTGTAADVEVALRTAEEPDAARFLDLALRILAHGSSQAATAAPEVHAVLVTTDHVEVRLDRAHNQAPPSPFERAAPDRWRLARSTPVHQLQDAAAQAVAPLPGLVTVGQVEDTRVLLNLEAPGMVALAGDPISARALLDAWAVELATSVWSDYLDLVLVGFGNQLALGPLERVRHVAALEEVLPTLERRIQRARQLLETEGHASAAVARMTSPTPDSWTPTVLLCANPPSPAALARLFPTEHLSHGLPLAIVAIGELPSPAWRIELAGGRAAIHALDLIVRSVQLTPEAYQAIVTLLSTAASPQDVDRDTPPYDTLDRPAPAQPTDLEISSSDDAATPAGSTTPDRTAATTQRLAPVSPIEVCVLGRIELRGVPRIQRAKSMELIVYLALHPTGVDLERVWEALWPERPLNRSTLHAAASIARARLGDGPDGTPYLPLAREGLYRLSPLIDLDWTRFQNLTQLAAHDHDRAIPALRQALDLVRGIPLDAITPGDYEWALVHRTEMEAAIGDAADQLAHHYLDQHNPTDATWAARRGLLATPYDERLYRQLMRAAYTAGNPAGVDTVMRELLHVLDAEDQPLDDLHPDTIALYKQLRGTRPLRT
jgi:DNA-binding SARP family transcriptional activator